MLKTFFKYNQPANTPVTILKRVDGFKAHMKIKNTIKGDF